MDPQALWLIVLSVATPLADVVGFAIQLRQVKKTRLENEKLQLEIAAIKATVEASERRVIQVTTDEVLRFASKNVAFSLSRGDDHEPYKEPLVQKIKEQAVNTSIVLVVLILVVYFIYDLCRLASLLAAKL